MRRIRKHQVSRSPAGLAGKVAACSLAVLTVLYGCELPEEEVAGDLPAPVIQQLDGAAPVPEEVLPRAGHGVERIAVDQGGERVFASILDPESGESTLAEWRWNSELDRWDGPEPMYFSEPGLGDAEVSLAPDGSYLLFSSFRPTDQIGAADRNLWVSQWREGMEPEDPADWSDPWLVPTVHSPAWDGTPTLAMTGNIYFSSERDQETPGRDLYVAELDGGMWGAPQRLPEPVNSIADEVDPWVAPDESFLLFSSNREGSWDLYVAFAEDDGGWTEPSRLADPVVTDGDERSPVLTLGGEVLFFVRGGGELWWAPSAAAGADRPEAGGETAG